MPTVEKVENEYQIKSESHHLLSACFHSVIYFNSLPWQFIYFYTIIFSGCRTAVKCFHNLWWPVSHYLTWCCPQFEAIIKILRWTPCLCVQPSLWHCIPAALPCARQSLHAHKLWSKGSQAGEGFLGAISFTSSIRPSLICETRWSVLLLPGWQWGLKTQWKEVPEACGWGTA